MQSSHSTPAVSVTPINDAPQNTRAIRVKRHVAPTRTAQRVF